MSSFNGVIALAGDPGSAVAATVEIEAGMLTLIAGGSELGIWSLNEIEVEQKAGAFSLRADGEDLVLTTPDMAAFAEAVGVVAAAPKRQKRRRFGFRGGRDQDGEVGSTQTAVAVTPPPPPEDTFADRFAEPISQAAAEFDEPVFSTSTHPPASFTDEEDPAGHEPPFATSPDLPAFPSEEPTQEDHVVAESFETGEHYPPTSEPVAEVVPGFAATIGDESTAVDPLTAPGPVESETAWPAAGSLGAPASEEIPEPEISFAPQPAPVDPVPEASPEPPPYAAAEPAFDFAPPQPGAETPPPLPADSEPAPAPGFDFAPPQSSAEHEPGPPATEPTLDVPTAVEPADEPAHWSTMDASFDAAPAERSTAVDTWGTPQPAIGRWPEPGQSTPPIVEPFEPTPPSASRPDPSDTVPPAVTPALDDADTEIPEATDFGPPLVHPSDDLSDAAGRDVPDIAGISAIATPDRYVTVEPEEADDDLEARPDHGADMATQEEIAAWITDVNGDVSADGDQTGPVIPSRFQTLRNRSAENYSDEDVLSTPLTAAMIITAMGLLLGALLSWGIYELSGSLPIERLVTAAGAFAVAGGAYLGWRQDRRITGSALALGGGILVLATVYAYAREANVGVGYLLATAAGVAAVVLGMAGVTRFGHGPDPRSRD